MSALRIPVIDTFAAEYLFLKFVRAVISCCTLCCDPGGSGEADVSVAGLVVRLERTGRRCGRTSLGSG
jgi:hypothetical protein